MHPEMDDQTKTDAANLIALALAEDIGSTQIDQRH